MNKFFINLIFLVILIVYPAVASARSGEDNVNVELGEYSLELNIFNPLGGWGNVGILSLLSLIAQLIFVLLIVVWMFIAILAGVKIIRSQGNPDMIKGGMTSIKNMLAGVTIGLLFFIAISFLGSLTGAGNIFQWADSFQECSCKNAGDYTCYQYKFQAESKVEEGAILQCNKTEGEKMYGKGWFDPHNWTM